MNIDQAYCKWEKGDTNFSPDQIVLLKTYETLLEISNENIGMVMDTLEDLYVKCA